MNTRKQEARSKKDGKTRKGKVLREGKRKHQPSNHPSIHPSIPHAAVKRCDDMYELPQQEENEARGQSITDE